MPEILNCDTCGEPANCLVDVQGRYVSFCCLSHVSGGDRSAAPFGSAPRAFLRPAVNLLEWIRGLAQKAFFRIRF
jgi:hypothetical protein